ncbi:kinesin-like protein KIFC1 [Dermacentor silvarum]|uniref:kinesin-like protein KIFC1 n=1 Tax=Dermacentor silvarum TaxID=543639 RepID=UPI001898AC81|nr:kinesin-like protein KIFC1 [Dermacentor silvarum]
MSQPNSLPGGSSRMAGTVRKLRSPTKRPAVPGFGGLRRSVSTTAIKENQRVGVADQPKRPRPGAAMPVPLGRLHRNVAGSALNLANGTASGPRPKGATSNVALAPSAAGKRKPWDLQGRLHDLEERMKSVTGEKEQLSQQSTSRLQELEKINAQLQAERDKNAQLTTRVSELESALSSSEAEKRSACAERDSLSLQLRSATQQVATLERSLADATGALAGLRSERAALMAQQESLESQRSTLEAERARLESSVHELRTKVAEQEEQLNAAELDRRKLHNSLQELKGNIRVFCRLRPLLPSESAPQRPFLLLPDDRTVEVMRTDPETQRQTALTFSFDRVFPGVASQGEVFAEVSQLVQSALDGYHVCIFAYGQTGAGKTHTMEGPAGELALEDERRGLIPRALHQVFEETLKQPHWTYTMVASFIEVYNETLRDLLVPPSQAQASTPLQLKMARKDGPVAVANLTEVAVTSAEQISQLLRCARKNRAVAATKCNERSSRSHSVFRLDIVGHNSHSGLGCRGRLNLVDLAGSERLSESQSEGARLREAQNINRSLANLGNVILALSNRADHVPYRNSKLTHLLMDSLGGNSKTLMLLNVSPREENINETINSLRFATKVNQCHIGTARKNL